MNFKVGDRVKFRDEIGTIYKIDFKRQYYPIFAMFEYGSETFTLDGRRFVDDSPELKKFDLDKKIQKILKF